MPGASAVPLISNETSPFRVEGVEPAAGQDLVYAEQPKVTPGYFRAMGIGLLRGRTFSESDVGRRRASRHRLEGVCRQVLADAARPWASGSRLPTGRGGESSGSSRTSGMTASKRRRSRPSTFRSVSSRGRRSRSSCGPRRELVGDDDRGCAMPFATSTPRNRCSGSRPWIRCSVSRCRSGGS